jgi:hypothetical protein
MFYQLKPMEIMASFSFLIHMNVKEFKPKIHLIKIKFKFQFKTYL